MKIQNKRRNFTVILAILLILCFTTLFLGTFFVNAEQNPSNLFTYDDQTMVEQGVTVKEDYLDKTYSGVKVTSTHANTVKLKQPIDISKNTKEDVLTEFVALPKNSPAQEDFSSLTITLTDANNPDNNVRILVYTGNTTMYVSTWLVVVSVAPPGTNTFGFRSSGSGLPMAGISMGGRIFRGTSFSGDGVEGRTDNGGDATALRIYYDKPSNSIYAANDKAAHQIPELVADLSDSAYTGIDNEWYGFDSDQVYISYTAEGVTANQFSYLITNINGQSYAEAKPKDEKAPILKVDLEGYETLPNGEVGKAYRVFDATAYDDLDGVIAPDVKVIKGDKEYEIDSTNHTFHPDEAGTYTIKYIATDEAGLSASEEIEITVKDYIPALTFTFDVKEGEFDVETQTSCYVGETLRLPGGVMEGGSGKRVLDVVVEYQAISSSNRLAVEIKDSAFKADKYGYYVVTYKATDYLGNEAGGEYWIAAVYAESPIVEYPSVPQYMIIGKTYRLSDFSANIYSKDAVNGITAKKTITVQDSNGKVSYNADEAVYTAFGSVGEKISITYKAENSQNASATVQQTFDVTLVSPQNFIEYFRVVSGSVDGSYDYLKMLTVYETQSDAKMIFLNALPANNFEFLALVKKSYANYGALTLTLTDSIKQSEKIQIKIKNEQSQPVLYLNGEYIAEMEGIFGRAEEIEGTDGSIKIKIDDNYKVSDSSGSTLCRLSKTLGGLSFSGFTSGKIYLEVELSQVEGVSGFELLSLCSQVLMDESIDGTGPVITLKNKLISECNLAEKVSIPAATAIDVLDPYTQITVSVFNKETNEYQRDINGVELKDVSIDLERFFVPSQTGEYTIRYRGVDSQGNPTTKSYTLSVGEKTSPVITLSGEVPQNVTCGKTVKLPSAEAWDNSNPDITLYAYYVGPDGKIVNVSDFSFEATMKGLYKVYYYACDEYSNYCLKMFTIKSV